MKFFTKCSRLHKLNILFNNSNKKLHSQNSKEVYIESYKNKGRIILNRPNNLNTLNLSVLNQIYPVLKQWENTKNFVIIKGADDNFFCGGKDIKYVIDCELKGEHCAKRFFNVLLSLTALIARYKIPFISLMNGMTIGDGAGISVHGKYRIVTENSILCMPDVSLGFFPTSGTSHFLCNLNGELGRFLALTGYSLIGRDIERVNLATHFCDNKYITDLESNLMECVSANEIDSILEKYEPEDKGTLSLRTYLPLINECFSSPTVEDMIDKLDKSNNLWADEIVQKLTKMSPMSLKVTNEALNRASFQTILECLEMEYQIVQTAMVHRDVYEAAESIEKNRKPIWRPGNLLEVTPELVNSYFPKMKTRSVTMF